MNARRRSWFFAVVFALAGGLAGWGCSETFYEKLGFGKEEAKEQADADRDAAVVVLAEGRETVWQVASLGIAAVSAIATGLLGRWIGKERKLTKAVIRGVEKSNGADVKDRVFREAVALGVETRLNKRVGDVTADIKARDPPGRGEQG